MITYKEVAAILNYIDDDKLNQSYIETLVSLCKDAGLIIIYPKNDMPNLSYSTVIRGHIEDRIESSEGEKKLVYIGEKGVLDCEECKARVCSIPRAELIVNDYKYQINIPFSSFAIVKDFETYSKGIVFSVSEIINQNQYIV